MATIEIRDVLDNETGQTIFPRTHVNAVIGLKDTNFFEAVDDGNGGLSVKLKPEYQGLWAEGWISSGGIGTGSGGGGGGATYLNDLEDVNAPNPDIGDILSWNGTAWINISDYGVSLSLSHAASFLLDSNGNKLKDSNGNYLTTGSSSDVLNLLNGDGQVISSVTLPIPQLPSTHITVGSATISLGGSATLSQIGIPTWAQSQIPGLYIGTTQVRVVAEPQDLEGITSFKLSAPESLVKWENDAWHFYGNVYVDGWLASGGVGSGGSGSVVYLDDLEGVTISSPTNGQALIYRNGEWTNESIQTGGGTVTAIQMNGTTLTPTSGIVNLGTVITSLAAYTPTANLASVALSGSYNDLLNKPTFPTHALGTQLGSSASRGTMLGVSAISYDLSSTGSEQSLIKWDSDRDAWHFYGNVYADGWIASGGVGSGGSGSASVLDDLDDVDIYSPSNGQALVYRNGEWTNETIESGGDVSSVKINGTTYYPSSGVVNLGTGYATSSDLSDYLPIAGGTLTGDLRLKDSGNYGKRIRFGDGDYAYIHEFADDKLKIYAADGITLSTSSNESVRFDTTYIDFGPVRLEFANNALHVTTNDSTNYPNIGLYADGFVSSGGIGTAAPYVRYVECTQTEYTNLSTKDATTIYIITSPSSKVYLGTIQLYPQIS